MTVATSVLHASKEFPVLLRYDGTSYPIQNKGGKLIQGGAKPTMLNFVPPLPAPVPKAVPKPMKLVHDKEWAVKLVTTTDSAELAARIVAVDDLMDPCSGLHAQFSAFKQTLPGSKELTVFHGTSPDVARKIIQSGFDWRYNQRHAYGKGNYFATTASYAIGVAPSEGGLKSIIVALIVYTNAAKGLSSMILPPDGFDATVDDERAPNIFVTYKVTGERAG